MRLIAVALLIFFIAACSGKNSDDTTVIVTVVPIPDYSNAENFINSKNDQCMNKSFLRTKDYIEYFKHSASSNKITQLDFDEVFIQEEIDYGRIVKQTEFVLNELNNLYKQVRIRKLTGNIDKQIDYLLIEISSAGSFCDPDSATISINKLEKLLNVK